MQKPLIGESSGGGDRNNSSSRSGATAAFTSHSAAITRGSRYQKAAALVDLAEDGVGIPEEIFDRPDFETAANLYFVFIQFDFLWTLNYFALIILNFFEKPLWCTNNSAYTCSDRDYYYLGQLPYLTGSESLILEGVTLAMLVAHIFFPISYEGPQIYWKDPVNRLKVICLFLLVADLLVYALYLSPVALDSLPLRIAPYIRVVFFILSIRDLQRSVLILAGMLGTYLNILALWLLFLLFSSWLAYVIFEDTLPGKTVFSTYGATLYQMLVLFTTSNNPDVWVPAYKTCIISLFTTSNNPDVWVPAYKASRWYCLFIVLYVLLGVYFVTNLILAVVYDSFKSQLAKQVSEMDSMRRRILAKAFSLIDEYNAGFLNKEQCIMLFEELNNYRTLPNISKEEFELIFDELDDSHDFKINLDEFADLCHAIALRFQKEDVPSCFEKCPSIYHSPFSKKLKTSVQSLKFSYIISFILVLNLIAVIIETTLDIENNSAQKVWQSIEFVFGYGVVAFGADGYGISLFFLVPKLPDSGWIYVIEMALKVYSFGFLNYWRDGQNRFDFLITWVIVIGETLTFASPNGLTFLSNGEWIRYLLLARMLRLLRILMYVKSYRAFIATFLTLIPSLVPYLGMIFCVMCIYCSLGVQIFGGLVNAGDPTVGETDLAESDYLLFNFNDYPNGMVSLFNLLVLNNWQVWMQGYKQLTGTSWAFVYFISFYLITVLLLLNLVVAFVLEAFFAEMELETSENFGEENKDAKDMKDRHRYVGTKTRSQRVDMLLHHMLSAELGQVHPSNADL